jgi:hypothetical protein
VRNYCADNIVDRLSSHRRAVNSTGALAEMNNEEYRDFQQLVIDLRAIRRSLETIQQLLEEVTEQIGSTSSKAVRTIEQ